MYSYMHMYLLYSCIYTMYMMPGARAAPLQWRRWVDQPVLQHEALAQYRSEIEAVPSLKSYLECQPRLVCSPQVHGGRLEEHVVREWTLAPSPSLSVGVGRVSVVQVVQSSRGNPRWSLIHGLRVCPLFGEQRQSWMLHMQRCRVDVEQLSNDEFLRLMFCFPVRFVASVCSMPR